MKTKYVTTGLILASSLIAGTSFASDGGALTREQVRAAYFQARAEGSLPAVGDAYVPVLPAAAAASTVSREAVKAEYFAARSAGALPAPVEGPTVSVGVTPSQLTREAVKADFFLARNNGTLPQVGDAS